MWPCTSSICGSIMYAVQDQVYPIHPLHGSLPVPFVPMRVTRGAVIALRHTYAPLRCRTSQYRWTFVPSQYLCGTILLTPYSIVWDWRVSRAGPMPFYFPSCSLPLYLLLFSLSFPSFYGLYFGAVVFGLIGCLLLSPSFVLPTFFKNNKK